MGAFATAWLGATCCAAAVAQPAAVDDVIVRSVNPRPPALTELSLTGRRHPEPVTAELIVTRQGAATLTEVRRGVRTLNADQLAAANARLEGLTGFAGARLLCSDDAWEISLTFDTGHLRLGFSGARYRGAFPP